MINYCDSEVQAMLIVDLRAGLCDIFLKYYFCKVMLIMFPIHIFISVFSLGVGFCITFKKVWNVNVPGVFVWFNVVPSLCEKRHRDTIKKQNQIIVLT